MFSCLLIPGAWVPHCSLPLHQNSPGLSGCVTSTCQPRTPQLTPTITHTPGGSSIPGHVHAAGLTLVTGLYCHVRTPGKTLQLQKRVSIAKVPRQLVGPDSATFPVTGLHHWLIFNYSHDVPLHAASPTPITGFQCCVSTSKDTPQPRRALRARPPTANCGSGSEPVFSHWLAPLSSSVASRSIYAPVHSCSDSLSPASPAICVPMKRPCSHRRACRQPYVDPNPALYPVSSLHHWVHLLLAIPIGHLYSLNLTSNTGIFYHVPIVRIRKTTGTAWWIFKPLYLPVSALGPDPCCFPEIPPLHLCLQLSLALCRHQQLAPTIKHGHTIQLPALGLSNWTWSHCWRTMLLFESLWNLCSACQGPHSYRWCGTQWRKPTSIHAPWTQSQNTPSVFNALHH